MGMPRKRCRKLDIDGKPFIFMVKETHIEDHRDQKELSVTVQEDAEKPGRVLQFRLGFGSMVTPFLVQHVAKQAFTAGWNPSERGRAFELTNFETNPA